MAEGRLKADPLYQGLARPPMLMGVSYMYFTVNGLVTLLLFIHAQSFLAYVMGAFIHLFGYLLCMKEPRAIELWALRMSKGYLSWNRRFHSHTNSYDVF